MTSFGPGEHPQFVPECVPEVVVKKYIVRRVWCSGLILFDFKITKSTVIFSVGGGMGVHAVWRVHSEGKKAP